MSFPARTTLPLVYRALIEGFNGIQLTRGGELTAAGKPDQPETISNDVLPFLLFDVGAMTMAPWNEWEELCTWDVPARLKVLGVPGDVDDTILDVLWDLILRAKSIVGLPIDETGSVVPFNDRTAYMFDEAKPQLMFLAERGAPVLKSIRIAASKGPYIEADLIFGVSTIFNFDPRTLHPMEKGVFGLNPVGPGLLWKDENGVALTADGDRIAIVAQNSPPPDLGNAHLLPPLDQVPRRVAGTDPRTTVVRLNVTPYTVTLYSVLPTAQLTAIAFYGNNASAFVTQQAAWVSSDPSVATVSASGLVQLLTLGSTIITASFGGISASATITGATMLVFTTAGRPAANTVGASPSLIVVGWNSDDSQLNFSNGTNWFDPFGNILA